MRPVVRETARRLLERFKEWKLGKNRYARHADRCLANSVHMRKPTTPSEFDVQATVWAGLRALGYECHGQVQVTYDFSAQRGVCDLAVYRHGVLVGIVEVKKDRGWNLRCTDAQAAVENQVCRYALKHTVYLVCGLAEATSFLSVVAAVGHLPDVSELTYHRCTVDHVVVMSEYRFEWNGQEIFREATYGQPQRGVDHHDGVGDRQAAPHAGGQLRQSDQDPHGGDCGSQP